MAVDSGQRAGVSASASWRSRSFSHIRANYVVTASYILLLFKDAKLAFNVQIKFPIYNVPALKRALTFALQL